MQAYSLDQTSDTISCALEDIGNTSESKYEHIAAQEHFRDACPCQWMHFEYLCANMQQLPNPNLFFYLALPGLISFTQQHC